MVKFFVLTYERNFHLCFVKVYRLWVVWSGDKRIVLPALVFLTADTGMSGIVILFQFLILIVLSSLRNYGARLRRQCLSDYTSIQRSCETLDRLVLLPYSLHEFGVYRYAQLSYN